VEVKRDKFKSQMRLSFADVPKRRQFVHDETEIQTHRRIEVSDGCHRSTLLTTEWVSRPVPAALTH